MRLNIPIAIRRAKLVALFVCAILAPQSAVAQNANASNELRVERLDITGSISYTPDELRVLLVTREGELYVPQSLDNDIHMLHKMKIFELIEWAKPVIKNGKVALSLKLKEKPILEQIDFYGTNELTKDDLKKSVENMRLISSAMVDKLKWRRKKDGPLYVRMFRKEHTPWRRQGDVYTGLNTTRLLRLGAEEVFKFRLEIEKLLDDKARFGAKVISSIVLLKGATSQDPERVKLRFEIDEGLVSKVKNLRIVGNSVYEDDELASVFKMLLERKEQKGEIFELLDFERAITGLKTELYQYRGYLDAEIKITQIERFTETKPNGEVVSWLVPRIEIDEGELYTIGKVNITVMPPKGTDPMEVNTEDITNAVISPGEEYKTRERIPLNTGMPYSLRNIKLAKKRINDLMGHFGRIDSKVEVKTQYPKEGTLIDVSFVVKPSQKYRLRGIQVRGNTKTMPYVFYREVLAAEVKMGRRDPQTNEVVLGDVIDTRKLDLAEQKIRYLGLVKNDLDEETGRLRQKDVNMRLFPREDGAADLYIDVNEGETGMLQMGLTFSSNDEIAGMVELSQRNFNLFGFPSASNNWTGSFSGAGQTLSISGSWGTSANSLVVKFEEPYLAGLPIKLTTSYTDRDRTYSNYIDGRNGVMAGLSHSWSLNPFKRRQLGASIALNDELVDIEIRNPLTAPAELLSDAGRASLRSVAFGLNYDTRDKYIAPSKGFFAKLTNEQFGGIFGGDLKFSQTSLDVQKYFRLGLSRTDQPYILQFRVRAKYASAYGDTDIPFYEKYFAGGWGTLRGFEYRSVGPKDIITDQPIGGNLTLLETIEYTWPLGGNGGLRGVLFYDAGNVWSTMDDYDGAQRQSYGFGFQIRPPGWPMPISFNWGHIIDPQPGDDGEVMSFNIGTMFF